jgi:hypothetical protein
VVIEQVAPAAGAACAGLEISALVERLATATNMLKHDKETRLNVVLFELVVMALS